ncbi:MAG: hypothetical protein HN392_10790 [Anaerolineae bacterium]|jgi:hypothetical protein|nr:hypothetical protein [Anaerolineae bacterium]MBT7073415.1 hypothetical protein [Anaerolineae bacterium]MBT7783224.1 hypothetical protein [Anaerolineae bacterium]
MIARAKLLFPLLIFSLACGLLTPVTLPTPTLDPAIKIATEETDLAAEAESTRIALFTPTHNILATQLKSNSRTATAIAAYTSAPSPSATPQINPEDLVAEENPLPPAALSPGENYRLKSEILIGPYGIRHWHHTNSATGAEDLVLIEKTGMESIRIESASEVVTLTDTDINGDNHPDIIVKSYTGGAHCCFGTQVYSLGKEPILILEKPESNATGEFKDLDDDGIYEFITADDTFAYQYCPFVSSPFVKVIMAYSPEEQKFIPASPNFTEEYAQDITDDTYNAERVSRANISENGEWDETIKCSVLPLMLDYIYIGEIEAARTELERLYNFDDTDRFWNEIMLSVQNSPLYIVLKE